MNKQDLISKIKKLDGVTQDERAYLINLVNTKKKYGLVWEDKPEDVEEQLRDNLPVLKEVKDKDGNVLKEGTDYEVSYDKDNFTDVSTIKVNRVLSVCLPFNFENKK